MSRRLIMYTTITSLKCNFSPNHLVISMDIYSADGYLFKSQMNTVFPSKNLELIYILKKNVKKSPQIAQK